MKAIRLLFVQIREIAWAQLLFWLKNGHFRRVKTLKTGILGQLAIRRQPVAAFVSKLFVMSFALDCCREEEYFTRGVNHGVVFKAVLFFTTVELFLLGSIGWSWNGLF
jgi:hypothetical protein